MPVKIRYQYSKKVSKGLKERVSKDIVNAVESSKAMRAEIRRVFHMANRRIQNIESAGLISPALVALGKSGIDGFSKFSISGLSWEQLKVEYGRCVAFLNQPTSSASGAREFERQTQAALGCTSKQWEIIKHDLANGYMSGIDALYSRMPYSELMQEIYERAEMYASNQMENEAYSIADAIQRQINESASEIAGDTSRYFEGFEM